MSTTTQEPGTALAPRAAGALSTEPAVPWERDYELAAKLSKSGLIPAPLRNRPDDVMVVLLTGRELRLQPMHALRSIHVVDGKPVMSADLMAALVLNSGVCGEFRCVEMSEERAVYLARRVHEPEPTRYEFTKQDAVRAGVMGKTNWRNYPKAMLRARACASAARAHFPDVVAGIYESDSEEIVAGKAEVIDMPAPKKGRSVADFKKDAGIEGGDAVTSAPVPNPPQVSEGAEVSEQPEPKPADDPRPLTTNAPPPERERTAADSLDDAPNPDGPEPPMGALADDPQPKPEDESQDARDEWEKVADYLIGKLDEVKAKPHLQNLKKKYAAEFDGVKLHAPEATKRLLEAWNRASDRVHTAPKKD
jgi:hypothetical protein